MVAVEGVGEVSFFSMCYRELNFFLRGFMFFCAGDGRTGMGGDMIDNLGVGVK